MVYYVAGANIFRQWPWEDLYTNEFRAVTSGKDSSVYSTNIELIHVNWAYNIVRIRTNNVFYVIGAWKSKINQLVELPFPDEYNKQNTPLTVVGNDNKIVLLAESKLWVLDLNYNNYKILNFNVEQSNTGSKKLKVEDNLAKVELKNDSCIYLTNGGCVYTGLLPSIVDTSHCNGKVIDSQCGFEHFVLLTSSGSVYTWGSGRRLQLGHNDVSYIDVPTEVDALGGINIVKITPGGWHTLALSESGDLYAWGWNNTGQLGVRDSNEECLASYPVPTLVDLIDDEGKEVVCNVKDVVCGSRHSAILLDDNSVWSTGYNKYGQLGLPPELYPSVNYFKKVYNCNSKECQLIGGPWNTIIKSS